MKKVIIEPGCIACGACEFIAPEIFEVGNVSQVKKDAPLLLHKEAIAQAVQECPVQVIKCEEE